MNKIYSYIINLALAYMAVFTKSMDAVIVSITLAVLLVVIDFASGVAASMLVDHVGIKSKRLRWSFAKTAVYSITILGTLCIGVFLHLISTYADSSAGNTVINWTLAGVKYEAYVASWVEIVSILENLIRIFPTNTFLKFIHYVVAVNFIKKIPLLANYFKETEEKPEANETK